MTVSALRSGPVRFFHPFGREPGPNRFYTFHEGTKNWTGPYRTGPLQLRAVTGPVVTSPELTSVLTSPLTGQDQLSSYLLTTYTMNYIHTELTRNEKRNEKSKEKRNEKKRKTKRNETKRKKKQRNEKHLTIPPASSGSRGWMWVLGVVVLARWRWHRWCWRWYRWRWR
jgi:hypothetical protein